MAEIGNQYHDDKGHFTNEQNDVGGEIGKISDGSLRETFKKAWEGGNETSRKIIDNAPNKIAMEFKPRGASYYSSTDKKVFFGEESRGRWRMVHEPRHAIP